MINLQINQEQCIHNSSSKENKEANTIKHLSLTMEQNNKDYLIKNQNQQKQNKKQKRTIKLQLFQKSIQLYFSQKEDQTIKKNKKKNLQQDYNNQQQLSQSSQQIQPPIVCLEQDDSFNQDHQINNYNKFQSNNMLASKEDIIKIFDKSKLNEKEESQKYDIYQKLLNMNYKLEEYVNQGGQACVFSGFFKNQQGMQEDCVFKIYFNANDTEFKKEIDILKSFEMPLNIVQIIDSIKIDQFFILILEKCKYSLYHELKKFTNREKIFSVDNLLQIIFDLVDGLNQLRVYNTLHLDIKPGNILISKQENYCYSDFGTSHNIKKNKEIQNEICTENYASPEQLKQEKDLDFQSDVYSLGKTFKKVINIFKLVNQEYKQEQPKIIKLIELFENIIENQMIQEEKIKRTICQNLHEQFLQSAKIVQSQPFFNKYQQKINQIFKLYPYDQNKDIQYFLELDLFYKKTQLNLFKNYHNNNYLIDFDSLKPYKSYIEFHGYQNGMKNELESQQYNQDLNVCQNQSKYFLKLLEMTEQIFQKKHIDIAVSLNKIASCYLNLGDNKLGLKYLLESLEMTKQMFQGIHPNIATILNNIGLCYANLRDNKNSEKYLLQSLEMKKQIFKGNHPDIATTLNNIGLNYGDMGDNKNGLKYLLESLEMSKQLFQKNHPQIATSLNNVGIQYQGLGDNKNSLNYYLESLQMREQNFQGIHPDTAQSLHNVGTCSSLFGDYQIGLKYLLESLEMYKQIFQRNHPFIATTLSLIGYIYQSFGDNINGLEYLLESLEMNNQFQQRNHLEIESILNFVALCYIKVGDYKNGLKYILESLEITKQNFQGDLHSIAVHLNKAGLCYQRIREYKTALKYHLESLEMYKQNFQGNHIDIVESLIDVRENYMEIGDCQNALKYSLESLEMRKHIFQGNHPDIATSLNNIGEYYSILGDNKNGLEYLLESLQMRKQIFQGNHQMV